MGFGMAGGGSHASALLGRSLTVWGSSPRLKQVGEKLDLERQ